MISINLLGTLGAQCFGFVNRSIPVSCNLIGRVNQNTSYAYFHNLHTNMLLTTCWQTPKLLIFVIKKNEKLLKMTSITSYMNIKIVTQLLDHQHGAVAIWAAVRNYWNSEITARLININNRYVYVLCVWVSTCILRVCTFVWMCPDACTWVYEWVRTRTHTCLCTHMYVSAWVYVYLRSYIPYICVYVFIHAYV